MKPPNPKPKHHEVAMSERSNPDLLALRRARAQARKAATDAASPVGSAPRPSRPRLAKATLAEAAVPRRASRAKLAPAAEAAPPTEPKPKRATRSRVPAATDPAEPALLATASRPRPATRRDKPRIETLVELSVESLASDKAEDIVVLDLEGKASFADRMIVATGLAGRQIDAMSNHLLDLFAKHGLRRVKVESSEDWVLIDAGDLVVHLFRPDARAAYALEKMWGLTL